MRYRKLLLGPALLLLGMPIIPAKAQSLEQQIEELRQKLSDLEQQVKINARKEELKEEQTAEKAKSAPSVSVGANGFVMRSGESESGSSGDFQLKFGADVQIDNRTFPGASSLPLTDQILLRRVRPTFSGTVFKYVDFYVRPDFGQGSTVLYEAYLQFNQVPRANVRVGKFKPPVGLERLQSDDDTNFIERGFPTLLVPSRDIGYQISGDIVKRRVNYTVGVFNGVPDNGLSDLSVSDHRDYAARLFLTPFLPDSRNPLGGLGFGIGATSGNDDGIALPSYKTFGQNAFFTFAPGVTSAGHRTRLAPQAYYYLGPFGMLAEYTLAEEGFQKGAVRKDIAFRAWQVQVSYLLTGESKGFATLAPRKAFDPRNHGWGAVELAVRVGDFSAEDGIYNYGFVLPSATPRRAHEWVGGINWYLNRMLRISLDYGNTNFEGGATHGDRPSEKALLERFQVNF